MKRVMITTSNRREVDELVSFSLEHLAPLRLPSGLYCHDMTYEKREPRGESVRYSLMVLLGMQRAEQAGLRDLPDLGELWLRCLERQDSFSAGDIGLALWADTRQEAAAVDMLLARLERIASSDEALSSLVGMEVAWILIGLTQAAVSHSRAERPLHQVYEHLTHRRRAPSGIYYHDASSRLRRRLPNFATEIYTLLALSRLARHRAHTRRSRARTGARRAPPAPPVARRWLAVALRRRPRHGRGALRGVHGAPGRDGSDGPARLRGADRRNTMGRSCGGRTRLVARGKRAEDRSHRHPRTDSRIDRSETAPMGSSGCSQPTASRRARSDDRSSDDRSAWR